MKQLALDIDLDVPDWFGWWFAGLVDGEGSFELRAWEANNGRRLTCSIQIGLRDDDTRVLQTIQSTLQVGRLHSRRAYGSSNPQTVWKVNRLSDLHWIIIPLLKRCPLQSKKRRDFEVWRKGVELAEVARGGRQTARRAWTGELWNKALALVEELQAVRQYPSQSLREAIVE